MMKTIGIVLIMAMIGCSSIDVEKTSTTWDVKYNSLFRELKDLYVNVDPSGVTVRLGSASTSDQLTDIVTSTGKMWLQGGPLLDMTGQPRAATPAEAAAQFEALTRMNR